MPQNRLRSVNISLFPFGVSSLMDLGPVKLARILLPRAPRLLMTAVLNTFSLSGSALKQDVRTALTVSVIRELLKQMGAIGQTQKRSIRDPGIKGKMWISKVTLPAPQDDEGFTPRDALKLAITELGNGSEIYTLPELSAVEAEWTGYRSGVQGNAPRPDIAEADQYERLMSEVKSDVTILYFHGGAYILMDPSSHRIPVSYLAKLTSGRCLSVRYRLAPQHPFPSAILDGLVAYLSLLSPPPGSLHSAVPAPKVVLAGDSAGGNLSLALLQTILTLQRRGVESIRFHGRDVRLELPAGLALNSPWCDISHALPSCHANAKYDYITPPPDLGLARDAHSDEVWPTSPPRLDLYTNASTLIHPLVSSVTARAQVWSGAPPIYMCSGNEALEDEIAVAARRMHEAGVKVTFDGYEGMPHCFAMIFPKHPMGKECMGTWARFITDVVEGRSREGESRATWAKAFSNPVEKMEVEWRELKKELSDEKVESLLKEKNKRSVEKEEAMVREWREKQKPSDQDEEPPRPRL